MTDQARVLIVGREVSDFLCDLYRDLNLCARQQYDLLELREIPKRNLDQTNAAFVNIHSADFLNLKSCSPTQLLAAFSPVEFARVLTQTKNLSSSIRSSLVARKVSRIFSEYDLVHFQFLTPECVALAEYIPKKVKTACTFWGSDLFLANRHFDYNSHARMLKRMNRITVHSAEMKQILLSKFGRDLEPKVFASLVVTGDSVFDRLQTSSQAKAKEHFVQKHNLKPDELTVVVGGAASPSGNHEKIVEGLTRLSDSVRARCRFVFPMTYGAPDEHYVSRIKDAVESAGLKNLILEKYLSDHEIDGMRLAADITIKLPDYDAFSLALCEDIYAGAIPVTGTWLPYGLLRTSGIHHVEVTDYGQLSVVLENVVDNIDTHRASAVGNADRIRHLLNQSDRIADWTGFYSNLVN